MIIFNNKGKASNFIKQHTDTRVFDVHSSLSIEDLYDYLLHHDDIPDGVQISQYNTARNPAEFVSVRTSDDDEMITSYYSWHDVMEENNALSQREAMRTARRRAEAASDYYRLESLFNGFAVISPDTTNNSMAFGSFTEVDLNRDEFISQLADALGVYPTLHRESEMSLSDKQALGKSANRLRWIFDGEEHEKIPPLSQVQVFETLDKYEKALIADGLYYPGDTLHNAFIIKAQHPSYIITPDALQNVRGARLPVSSDLVEQCRTLFEEKYRRAPRVLEEYVAAQYRVGVNVAQTIVDQFNLNSLKAVAQYGSSVLFALVPRIDFSQCKTEQIYFLATHITISDCRSLIRNGFGEWFSQHRNESLSDLNELLLSYGANAISWNIDMTARELIEYLKTRRGREDCAKYEESYHYRFSDNEVAIKGKGIVVRDGAFKMYFLAKDDYRNFTVGYDTNCCQHWYGAGENCVYEYTTDPFAACVVIERAGKILAQAFVFTDEINDTFVFDNIEFANGHDVADYANIIATFVKALPYKNVHMGTGYVEGQYRTWGQSLGTGRFNMAQMPTTLSPSSYIYTDYHSNARVFKADDMMFIRQGNGIVEHTAEEPTRWDALRDSGARVLLNDYRMPVEERLAFSGRSLEEIGNERLLQLLLDHPILVDSMDSVPDAWQHELVERRVSYKILKCIKNPTQEVRDIVLPELPEMALKWESCTKGDWTTALCHSPALTESCPYPLDTDMATAIYEACGEEALTYIPSDLLSGELLERTVSTNPRFILSLNEPSEDLLVLAVTRQPLLLSALPLITDRVGLAAIESMPASIIYWPDAPYSACETAILAQPTLIRNLVHRFPSLREVAINADPEAVWAVPNATDADHILAEHVRASQNPETTPPPEIPTGFGLDQFD